MDKELPTKDGKPIHDLTVKIRVEDFLNRERFGEVKALIAGIEKEYGDSHTLSFQIDVTF